MIEVEKYGRLVASGDRNWLTTDFPLGQQELFSRFSAVSLFSYGTVEMVNHIRVSVDQHN
jgi:hypothetical protein